MSSIRCSTADMMTSLRVIDAETNRFANQTFLGIKASLEWQEPMLVDSEKWRKEEEAFNHTWDTLADIIPTPCSFYF